MNIIGTLTPKELKKKSHRKINKAKVTLPHVD
jgi:hypothetical protein